MRNVILSEALGCPTSARCWQMWESTMQMRTMRVAATRIDLKNTAIRSEPSDNPVRGLFAL